MTENAFYGWFDDATQASDSPTYDPPHNSPCPYCGTAVRPDDVRTHCIMYMEGYAKRSYFYRTHRTCAEADKTNVGMDDFIFGMIRRNGD